MIHWVNPTRRSSRGSKTEQKTTIIPYLQSKVKFHPNIKSIHPFGLLQMQTILCISGKHSILNELTCTRAYIEYFVKIVLRDNKHFRVMNCSVLFPPKIFDMSTWQKQNSMSVKRHLAPTLLAAGFKHHGCLLVSTANSWDVYSANTMSHRCLTTSLRLRLMVDVGSSNPDIHLIVWSDHCRVSNLVLMTRTHRKPVLYPCCVYFAPPSD